MSPFALGIFTTWAWDYHSVKEINPSLIYVSITPFGQDGPYKDYQATDLIGMALSGMMNLTGDRDRPPVRNLHAPVLGYWVGRRRCGGNELPTTIVSSPKKGSTWTSPASRPSLGLFPHAPMIWDLSRMNMQRQGPFRPVGNINLRINWECVDGYVNFIQPGGHTGGRSMTNLSNWMDEEGVGHNVLGDTDWGEIGFGQLSKELLEQMTPPLERFFKSKTKAVLAQQALDRRILLFPVNDPKDVFAYPQLLARDFFREVPLPAATNETETMKTLGPFMQFDVSLNTDFRRAPRIGEHNGEVYQDEDGIHRRSDGRAKERKGYMTTSDKTALQGVKSLGFLLGGHWPHDYPLPLRLRRNRGPCRVHSSHRHTLRTATPHKDGMPGINRSGYFANYNGGKYSMALNMGQPEARDLAKDLARWADVVTENFTPGVMERWGLGYEDLKEINPRIIMFSASMQGRGGPYSNHPGFGPVLTALSSHTHLTGWPDRTPTSPYGAYTDFLLPHLTVSGIAAALDHRHRTGQGQHLDFSQLERIPLFRRAASNGLRRQRPRPDSPRQRP